MTPPRGAESAFTSLPGFLAETVRGNVRLHNAASREAVGSEANGLQVVWEEVGGMARMKWLLWTGENIDTATAKEWAWSRRSFPLNGPRPELSRSRPTSP
jgi:hypothetical protein